MKALEENALARTDVIQLKANDKALIVALKAAAENVVTAQALGDVSRQALFGRFCGCRTYGRPRVACDASNL